MVVYDLLREVLCGHFLILRPNIKHVRPCLIEEYGHHCFLGDVSGSLNFANTVRTECPDGSDVICI
jgi:hypothetical protein